MKRLILLAVIFHLLLLPAKAQKNVIPLPLDSNVAVKGNTFRYALPATAFKITVKTIKVRELKGYYAEHAQSLLGLSHIISENRTHYRLHQVQVQAIEVPDYKHAYLVELSSGQDKGKLLCSLFNEVLPMPPTFDIVNYTAASDSVPDFFSNYADPSFTQTEAAFVETRIIDGVVTQIPANKTKTVQKTDRQKAQEAADVINKSRQNQYQLASGEQETAYSAEAIKAMIAELKQTEENYLSLFKGLTLEDLQEYTFYVLPEAGTTVPLFSFSEENGISFSGNGKTYKLSLSPIFDLSACRTENSGKKAKTSGYRYHIPMPTHITLTCGKEQVHDFGIMNIYQFGDIQTLPTGLDNLSIHKIGYVF